MQIPYLLNNEFDGMKQAFIYQNSVYLPFTHSEIILYELLLLVQLLLLLAPSPPSCRVQKLAKV